MADKKVVFIAFAIEDETQRDLLKGQSLNTKSPFEYVDMSVKEPYPNEWKRAGAHTDTQVGRGRRTQEQELAFFKRSEMGNSVC